jgi:hypothetical protein
MAEDVWVGELSLEAGIVVRRWERALRNSDQSVSLKLCEGGAWDLGGGMLRTLMMGRWSASGGHRAGETSQLTKMSTLLSVYQTLSGLVQLPVLLASRVGMPGGRAMRIP